MSSNALITEVEGIATEVAPSIIGALLTKYEPNCDIAGAKTAFAQIIAGAIAFEAALTTTVTPATTGDSANA